MVSVLVALVGSMVQLVRSQTFSKMAALVPPLACFKRVLTI